MAKSAGKDRFGMVIKDSFGIPKQPYSDETSMNTPVERLLFNEKGADIFVKNKKDGNIDIEVRKMTNFNAHDEKDWLKVFSDDGFIPYDTKGKRKLKMTLNLTKPMTIIRNINTFVERCRDYAVKPESRKNLNLATDFNSKMIKEAIKKGLIPEEYL